MIIHYKNTPVVYDVYGKGEAVVLIHGFLEERNIWNPFIPVLKENNQLIVPDMFGHGESAQSGEVQTMEDMADLIRFILDELKIERVSLVGHSMGGYISMAFLERYPERVKRILLLNSSPREDAPERLKERDQVIKIAKKHQQIFVKSAVGNLFAEESKLKFKEDLDQRISAALKMDAEAIIASVKGMKIRKNRVEVLKNFQGKKYIIAGEEDSLIPYAGIRNIAEQTDSKFFGLPGGHMSYIEQKEEVIKILQEFLQDSAK